MICADFVSLSTFLARINDFRPDLLYFDCRLVFTQPDAPKSKQKNMPFDASCVATYATHDASGVVYRWSMTRALGKSPKAEPLDDVKEKFDSLNRLFDSVNSNMFEYVPAVSSVVRGMLSGLPESMINDAVFDIDCTKGLSDEEETETEEGHEEDSSD